MDSLAFAQLSELGEPDESPWETPGFALRIPCNAPILVENEERLVVGGFLALYVHLGGGSFFTQLADAKKAVWEKRMKLPGIAAGISFCLAVVGFGFQFVVFSDFSFSEGFAGPLFVYPALVGGGALMVLFAIILLTAIDVQTRASASVELPPDLQGLVTSYAPAIEAAQNAQLDVAEQALSERIKTVVETGLEQVTEAFTAGLGGVFVEMADDLHRREKVKEALDMIGRLIIKELIAYHESLAAARAT